MHIFLGRKLCGKQIQVGRSVGLSPAAPLRPTKFSSGDKLLYALNLLQIPFKEMYEHTKGYT